MVPTSARPPAAINIDAALRAFIDASCVFEAWLAGLLEASLASQNLVFETWQAAAAPRAKAAPPAVSVVRRGDEYAVVREGSSRASAVFDSLADAVGRARDIAHNEHADLRLPAPEAASVRPRRVRP
jgi:hypothetical protein